MTFPASRVGFAVHHARAGERVLMVVPERKAVAQVLTMLAHFGLRDGERLRRANGLEGFDHLATGGWIRFVSANNLDASRGIVAERVLVDQEVRPTFELLNALKLCAATIHHGEEG